MNSLELWIRVAAIAGSLLGFIGGIAGTYFSINNTNSPRERSFMIKSSVVCWIAILIFLGLILTLPNPWRYLMWIPYSILLPLGITIVNRKQQVIRQEELQKKV
jgi:hypothetical protein